MNNDDDDDDTVGGYGGVPSELVHKISDLLDDILACKPDHTFANGKTALFWNIIANINNSLTLIERLERLETNPPRIMSMVTFTEEYKQQLREYNYNPFDMINAHLIFLGEIVNMPGHCVLLDPRTNKIHSCYHTENFRECTEEEI